jgi:hypothetical protein
MNAKCLRPRCAPANKAIAATGVKFGQCGISLMKAPNRIAPVITDNLVFNFKFFIFVLFGEAKI